MSRSYKKVPYCGDKKNKETKRIANKAVRNYLKNPKHKLSKNSFKKVLPSWDICDYKWRMTRSEAINWYLNECKNMYIYKRFPTLDKWLNYWEKCHRRK